VIYHGGPDVSGVNNPLLKRWPADLRERILQKVGLGERDLAILFVGRIEFKKNLVRLVEGFCAVFERISGLETGAGGEKKGSGRRRWRRRSRNWGLGKM